MALGNDCLSKPHLYLVRETAGSSSTALPCFPPDICLVFSEVQCQPSFPRPESTWSVSFHFINQSAQGSKMKTGPPGPGCQVKKLWLPFRRLQQWLIIWSSSWLFSLKLYPCQQYVLSVLLVRCVLDKMTSVPRSCEPPRLTRAARTFAACGECCYPPPRLPAVPWTQCR